MSDGLVNIPLSGKPLVSVAEPSGQASPCHFLVGEENRLVEVAVRSVVQEKAGGYNPLVLYGASGTGKTHLAQGLAAAWKAANPRRRVVCTTATDFARELADAIESQGIEEFRAKHREASMLVVEDIGMLATRKSGKISAQEEFIHTLDALVAEDKWVVVTASESPAKLTGILPGLQSRLMSGLTIPLSPPGPETRLAILRQLAALREVDLPEDVAQVLADELSGTVPELAGVLMQMVMPSKFEGDELDMETARQYLADRNQKRHPTLHEIALATARHFTIRLADLRSPVRRRALVAARGVAVYLARRMTKESLDKIGSYFGGRDHTTVMHSYRKTEELMESDSAIREAVVSLKKLLWKN